MSNLTLKLLRSVKDKLDNDGQIEKPYRFLFLGYSDIHATDEYYLQNYGPNALKSLEQRPNVEKLKSIHSCGPNVSYIPTLKSVLKVMFGDDVEHEVFDFQKYEGNEQIIDLNDPIPEQYRNRYHFVIDAGTTEHVFDYAQALRNCATLVKLHGYIYHGVPMNWPNHGFYNISPTLYYDFYEDNGFKTILFKGFSQTVIDGKKVQVNVDNMSLTERFSFSSLGGLEVDLRYIVQKIEETDKYVNPIQRKYRDASRWI
ncbi:MAG: hypothetical protein V3T17_09310 [Pseudomonadales bacterium]